MIDELETVLDDSALLADRVVRSLHRNEDGHLSTTSRNHVSAITNLHNVAILYIYTEDALGFALHEHYVWRSEPCGYKEWKRIVHVEAEQVHANGGKELYGIYGWVTATVQITPLRNGDLFIKIDKEGATGVRLSFGPRKAKHETLRKKSARKTSRNSHRVRQ